MCQYLQIKYSFLSLIIALEFKEFKVLDIRKQTHTPWFDNDANYCHCFSVNKVNDGFRWQKILETMLLVFALMLVVCSKTLLGTCFSNQLCLQLQVMRKVQIYFGLSLLTVKMKQNWDCTTYCNHMLHIQYTYLHSTQ